MTTIAATTNQAASTSEKEDAEQTFITFHLEALKQHLTTWRQKLISSKGNNSSSKRRKSENSIIPPQQPLEEKKHHNQQSQIGKWLGRITRKEYNSNLITSPCSSISNLSFVQRTGLYCKTKLKATFNKTTKTATICSAVDEKTLQQFSTLTCKSIQKTAEGVPSNINRCYGRKVEIVAKLLSLDLIDRKRRNSAENGDILSNQRRGSTDSGFLSIDADVSEVIRGDFLANSEDIAASTSLEDSDNTTIITCNNKAETTDKMTITELTFLEIRDEYPDLDSEIRGILMARAQEGATIEEIKDDYRKLTGIEFPVYERITEFLLTIPCVSAYCSEKGTPIFNIRPMEKTKHIHEMVLQQKSMQQESLANNYKANYYRNYTRERWRNTNNYSTNWRLNSTLRNIKSLEDNQQQYFYQQKKEQQQIPIQEYQSQYAVEVPQTAKVNVCNTNVPVEGTEDYMEHNCCYNDNCLLNRMCSQQSLVIPIAEPIPMQTIAPPTMYAWNEQQQRQEQKQRQKEQQKQKEQLPMIIEKDTPTNDLNINANCYDNNMNHLNNLYRQANINNAMSRPRHSYGSRSRSPTIKSYSTNDSMFTDSDYEAHLLDFLLLGDDFLLYMARMELRCKFKKNQKILQSGLCVSGQTISAALRRIVDVAPKGRSVIVNIGSVNILQCRQLIQIEHEYRELIKTMLKKGIKPILTTLAPLANFTHDNEVKLRLERFNEFIKREGKRLNLVVIDIWKCLVNAKGHVLFDCYQSEPRVVTGAKESYLFWNKIGRQRVLQLIESHLEY